MSPPRLPNFRKMILVSLDNIPDRRKIRKVDDEGKQTVIRDIKEQKKKKWIYL